MPEDLFKLIQKAHQININSQLCRTEEATKTALILPMLIYLGWDIFDYSEVVPEFISDFGSKSGQKVDYAILQNQSPILIIECKHHQENLTKHKSQLQEYYATHHEVKIALLTNGLQYWFFTDWELEKTNFMDKEPFLQINLLSENVEQIEQKLEQFSKKNYSPEKIIMELKLDKNKNTRIKIIQEYLKSKMEDWEFYKEITRKLAYERVTFSKVYENADIIKEGIVSFLKEIGEEKIKLELKDGKEWQEYHQNNLSEQQKAATVLINTTEEELLGFTIVQNILSKLATPVKITYQDTEETFNILLEGTEQKCFLKFKFSENEKYLLPTNFSPVMIQKVTDVEKYADPIRNLVISLL